MTYMNETADVGLVFRLDGLRIAWPFAKTRLLCPMDVIDLQPSALRHPTVSRHHPFRHLPGLDSVRPLTASGPPPRSAPLTPMCIASDTRPPTRGMIMYDITNLE